MLAALVVDSALSGPKTFTAEPARINLSYMDIHQMSFHVAFILKSRSAFRAGVRGSTVSLSFTAESHVS